jgi:hypothetical protein
VRLRRFFLPTSFRRCCAPFQCELSIASVKVVRHRIGLFLGEGCGKVRALPQSGSLERVGTTSVPNSTDDVAGWERERIQASKTTTGAKTQICTAVYAALKGRSSTGTMACSTGTSEFLLAVHGPVLPTKASRGFRVGDIPVSVASTRLWLAWWS